MWQNKKSKSQSLSPVVELEQELCLFLCLKLWRQRARELASLASFTT